MPALTTARACLYVSLFGFGTFGAGGVFEAFFLGRPRPALDLVVMVPSLFNSALFFVTSSSCNSIVSTIAPAISSAARRDRLRGENSNDPSVKSNDSSGTGDGVSSFRFFPFLPAFVFGVAKSLRSTKSSAEAVDLLDALDFPVASLIVLVFGVVEGVSYLKES